PGERWQAVFLCVLFFGCFVINPVFFTFNRKRRACYSASARRSVKNIAGACFTHKGEKKMSDADKYHTRRQPSPPPENGQGGSSKD
ncbi:TPA: hypothetical protein ACV778_005638, partial [Escherichia coli]